jgi:predicted ArsR family transcriptional regulator
VDLLDNDRIKLRVLKQLLKSKELTMNAVRNELGPANYHAVRRACAFLETIGLVETEARAVGGRKYVWVRLTDLGVSVAKKL